ncbi:MULTISPECIES: helix-turn-helix domain-containing protein [Sphingobacterium]|uniref:helix-turn-helix domain-containing protein n=1 Tax=Sphingobacterium TaxID=28453 RepID=UPI0035E44C2F
MKTVPKSEGQTLPPISLKAKINRGRQLKFSREYRSISQSELCKQVQGLSQSNLSRFEKGLGYISDDVLIEAMSVLNFPFSWLDVPSIKIKFN